MTIAISIAAGLAVVGLVLWLGLAIRPAAFPSYSAAVSEAKNAPLPEDLPEPVDRYLRSVYGERVPVVDSVVVTGRGRVRPFGVWMPARFRFTHEVGKGYRHYIEVTLFGAPVMKINERYVDGRSLFETPFGTTSGPKVEQAANLGMWAELANAAPSALVTYPGVRWEPIDTNSAVLVVPFGESETQRFTVRFDPATGQLMSLEAPRYKEADSTETISWTAVTVPGTKVPGTKLEAVGEAVWADMNGPWARFETEELRYNNNVSAYLRARGI